MFDNFVSSEHITLGIEGRLSVLFGDHVDQVHLVLFDESLIVEHKSDSVGDRDLFPFLENVLRVGDNIIELLLSALRYLIHNFLGSL